MSIAKDSGTDIGLGRKDIDKQSDPQLGRKEIDCGQAPPRERGVISELGTPCSLLFPRLRTSQPNR